MKKTLSLLINICLLFSSFSFILVYAEESIPTITLSYIDNIETDKQVIVKATLSGGDAYCGFSFGITYDNSKLQPNSAKVESLFVSSIKPNLNKTENQVYFSYTSADPVDTNGDVVSFTFDVLDSATGKTNFDLVNIKMYDENYSNVAINGMGTSVELPKLPIPTLTLSTNEYVSSEDEFVVSATLANATNYCGISFGIIYDNTKLTPISAKVGTDFIGTVKPNLNKTENQVYFSYTGADAVSNNGKVVDFTFKVKNNVSGKVEFNITNFKMYDENYSNVENEHTDTETEITCTHKDVTWNETKSPKCDEKGLKEFECDCGFYDSEEIDTIPHNYEATVIPPTKTNGGYTKHVCSKCGDTYTDTPVDALGFMVTFDANGGEFSVQNQNKRPESDLTITTEVPTKNGYSFIGWATTDSATAAEYVAGGKYTTNDDVTLYAVWKINKYKLVYMVDGEIYKEYDVDYNSNIDVEATPTKDGYTFSGWSAIPQKMPAENVIVTGTFNVNIYNVIYIVDGDTYMTIPTAYGIAINYIEEPTRIGYIFSGWSTAPETMPDKDITITGTFSPIAQSTVSYINSKGNSPETKVYYAGSVVTIEENPDPVEGFTFAGWSNGTTTYNAGDTFVIGEVNITLTAIWVENAPIEAPYSLKVKFAREDGTSAINFAKLYIYNNSSKEELIDVIALEDEDTETAEISVDFTLVEGTYYVEIVKNGYLTFKTEIDVKSNINSSKEIKLVPGDIKDSFDAECGDGVVDIDDLVRVLRGFAENTSISLKAAVDIDEDGAINVSDIAYVKVNFNKTSDEVK